MSILWLIIKIILFVLLGLVLLLVVGVGVILLSPIRYEAYFEKYDDIMYDFKFRYLFGIKGRFYLEDDQSIQRVSAFGKVLYESKEVQKSEEEQTSENDLGREEPIVEEKMQEEVAHDEVDEKIKRLTVKKATKENTIKKTTKIKTQKDTVKVDQAAKKAKRKVIKKSKENKAFNLKDLLTDSTTYHGIKQIVKGLWHLLKYMAPRSWDFEVIVGTGEPADTGELIAKLTMLYPLYYRHGIIRGDYEEATLKGGFLAKGKFRLYGILFRLIQLYLKDDVRTVIEHISK